MAPSVYCALVTKFTASGAFPLVGMAPGRAKNDDTVKCEIVCPRIPAVVLMPAVIRCGPPERTGEYVAVLLVTEKNAVESMPSIAIERDFRSSPAAAEYATAMAGGREMKKRAGG